MENKKIDVLSFICFLEIKKIINSKKRELKYLSPYNNPGIKELIK
jgi:hypothetical protein